MSFHPDPKGMGISLLIALTAGQLALGAEQARLLFLGPQQPVILDVTIDAGQSDVTQIRQEYAKRLFRRLDGNGDDLLNEEEAKQIPTNGRLAANSDTLQEKWKSLDGNGDKAVDLEELERHLETTFGPPLLIEMAAPRQSQTARLGVDLDLDGDGRMTSSEIQQGLQRLRSLDFDDDDALSVAELQPFPRTMVDARQQQRRNETVQRIFAINTHDERNLAAERCLKEYHDDSREVPHSHIAGLSERWFRGFDRDRNGTWNAEEFAFFLSRAPADFVLQSQLRAGRVTIEKGADSRERRPKVEMGGVPVELIARDMSWTRQASVSLFKINFIRSDGDKNGYLDPTEFGGLQSQASFAEVDFDGNQQVTRDEVEDYFELESLARQTQLLISLSDETQTLFDILDGRDTELSEADFRLTPREIREGANRLLQHDLNGNGTLEQAELFAEFRMTFKRPEALDISPEISQNMQQQARGQTDLRLNLSGPPWFTKMDRNADRELQWREFLGPRETFDLLDKNRDGFLTEDEALIAEQMRGETTE
ncbi:MAG: hypothetical protein KDA80_24620 [Planctomycetaceae bacterium]|nr:hypothetical protein [Planctomycetaceae bacterium]